MLCFDDIQRLVCEWAYARPFILSVWLYGSYLRQQDFRPDDPSDPSDLDVAMQIAPIHGYRDMTTTWLFHQATWREELSVLLQLPVHLESYDTLRCIPPAREPSRVRKAVSRAMIHLYDAATGCTPVKERTEDDALQSDSLSATETPKPQNTGDSSSLHHQTI